LKESYEASDRISADVDHRVGSSVTADTPRLILHVVYRECIKAHLPFAYGRRGVHTACGYIPE